MPDKDKSDKGKPVNSRKPRASGKTRASAKTSTAGSTKKRTAKSGSKKATAKTRAKRATAKDAAPTSEQIAAEEKQARDHRAKLNIVQRVLVTQKIIILRHQPTPVEWAEISRRLEVPESTCRYYYREYGEAIAAARDPDREGMRVLDETLMMYQEIIELLGEATQKGENWAVKVGAARSLMNANRDRIELMVAMGRMPRNIHAQNHLVRTQTMLRRFYEVLEHHKATPDMLAALMAVLEERMPEDDVIEGTARALPAGD